MKFSLFGEKIARNSGITQLMDDLGNALSGEQDVLMLGGGNPAHIPELEKIIKKRMKKILKSKTEFRRLIGLYDPPKGNKEFIRALVKLLNDTFHWGIDESNIGLTNGSQSAFFILFNILGGHFEGGVKKQILFPLAPEYIGYTDLGLNDDLFVSKKPKIEFLGDHIFKYMVDFDKLDIDKKKIGAICVSRPTNPTGNVLTDYEIDRLMELASENEIPLIVDNAYGMPFPNIIYSDVSPKWNKNVIFCMSLSKLGLPAARTGIVVADSKYIKAMSGANAVLNLSTGSFGSMAAMDLVKSGEIINLSKNVIKPFYKKKVEFAVSLFKELMGDFEYYIHKPEGALFLWFWFKDMPITSMELYKRLKERGVLIVPGNYFFPGLSENNWKHRNECIRVNYTQGEDVVREGLKIIADEVKKAYL